MYFKLELLLIDRLVVCFADCKNVFALVVKSAVDVRERLFVFTLVSDEVPKPDLLRLICRHMADAVCRTDAVSPDMKTIFTLTFS